MAVWRSALVAGVWLAGVCSVAAHAQRWIVPIKEGEGKDTVEALCVACHPVTQIAVSSGYTREDWDALIATMIDLSGDPDAKTEVLDYLTTHYPPNDDRAARLVDGPLEVSFTEWVTPTLGQRTRDPVEAPDGAIWWVGQFLSIVGRLDPETGEMKEYQLEADARPHSVNIAPDGKAWYLSNGNGAIGVIDPVTDEITRYEMPDENALDPHTGEFDQDGIFWFTLQRSNMIGRLDPASGGIDFATLPREDSRPYGIKIAADGTPYVACNGNNCLIAVNPETMELTEIRLPHRDTHVRRLDIDDDGVIWYVNSGRGRLGRYDPETGDIEEWASPSGRRSHPYAIAVIDNIVWYNESGKRPDPLVRFDPATETFQSWAIPSGEVYSGIARHIRPTRDGDLLIHQSATNRIIRVALPPAR